MAVQNMKIFTNNIHVQFLRKDTRSVNIIVPEDNANHLKTTPTWQHQRNRACVYRRTPKHCTHLRTIILSAWRHRCILWHFDVPYCDVNKNKNNSEAFFVNVGLTTLKKMYRVDKIPIFDTHWHTFRHTQTNYKNKASQVYVSCDCFKKHTYATHFFISAVARWQLPPTTRPCTRCCHYRECVCLALKRIYSGQGELCRV